MTEVKRNPARYAAPALEKGLDLLEALADAPEGLGQRELAERVHRSVGEVFRMLDVLERRAYIARDPATGQYGLTLKLFEIAHRHEPTRRLQDAALPAMQALAEAVQQSCHLCIAGARGLLVVAQAEPRGPMVFTVKLGAEFPWSARYVSVRILAAFSEDDGALHRAIAAEDGADPALAARLAAIRRAGYAMAPSETTGGVTDLAVPVFGYRDEVRASLVIPLLPQLGRTPELDTVLARLAETGRVVSQAIGASPGASQHMLE